MVQLIDVKLPINAPVPRLCVVKKSFENDEYGFVLHAEGARQYIGDVDGK